MILGEEGETDSDSENDDFDEGLLVTLEVAKTQRHRNEKKRKAPPRRKAGSRRSKRLKGIQVEVKTEINEEIPAIRPASTPASPEKPNEEIPEVRPESRPPTPEATPEVNTVEIDEVKKEVIESSIPILNVPVSESQDFSEENERLLLSQTSDGIQHSQSNVSEMFFKIENLYEPSGKTINFKGLIFNQLFYLQIFNFRHKIGIGYHLI